MHCGTNNCSFMQCKRDPHPIYELPPTVGYQGHIPYLNKQDGVSFRYGVCKAIREFDCDIQHARCCLPQIPIRRSCCNQIGEELHPPHMKF
ncbi:hypothetical protein GJ496_009985, partial [Pomphorhynchus laevis]